MGKPAQRRGAMPSPAERALAARVSAAQVGATRSDPRGEHAAACRELAAETGVSFERLYAEFEARAVARRYDVESHDDAELLAMEDVLERFRAPRRSA